MGTKKGQKRKTARRAYEPKKKSFIGIEPIKGTMSALFYNEGAGERIIAIPMKEFKMWGKK